MIWAILITILLAGCTPIAERVRYACPSRLITHALEPATTFWEVAESYTGPQFEFGPDDRPSPDGWTQPGVSKVYLFESISISHPNTPGWTNDWVQVKCTYFFSTRSPQTVSIRWELPPDATCKIDNSMQRVPGGVVSAVAISKPYTALCVWPTSIE